MNKEEVVKSILLRTFLIFSRLKLNSLYKYWPTRPEKMINNDLSQQNGCNDVQNVKLIKNVQLCSK